MKMKIEKYFFFDLKIFGFNISNESIESVE